MNRRHFLKLAGTGSVGAGLLLSGCDILETDGQITDAGSDIELLKKVVEMEGIAVASYKAAAPLLTTQAVIDAAVSFMNSHIEHAESINKVINTLGGASVNYLNLAPDSRTGGVSTEGGVVALATTLEFEAAKAYFEHMFNSVVTTTAARQILANIYPIEAAHYLKFREMQNLDSIEIYGLFTSFPG